MTISKNTLTTNIDLIKELYKLDFSIVEIANKLGTSKSTLHRFMVEQNIPRRKGYMMLPRTRNKIGLKNRRDGYINSAGYKVKMINRRLWLEHHLVWLKENTLGLFFIPKGWIIHHIDFNKLNNQFINLMLLPRKVHTSIHMRDRYDNQ